MMPKSRIEWLAIIGGLMVTLIVLVYCGWRITITQEWLAQHRVYIQARDERWEDHMQRAEGRQAAMIRDLEGHLLQQDEHMKRQDADQAVILDHIRREEKLWPKGKP